jgi:predicted enzyme related to lactoylglutathione lyase
MANLIVWCDIPVLDLDRAVKFYSAVLGQEVKKHEFPGMTVGVLPHDDGEVGGCFVLSVDEKPSEHGVMSISHANGRLDDARLAAVPNGGKVVQPKHSIGPFRFAFFRSHRQRGQSSCAIL